LSNYYYLVASLPMLDYEKTAAVTVKYFLEICAAQLKPYDYALLKNADFTGLRSSFPQAEAYRRYRSWEVALRNELVRLRALKKGEDPVPYLKAGSEVYSLKMLAKRVFEESSPLQAENLLNRGRWDYLEELEIGHFFDINKIVIYYLKLQLLTRKAYFRDEPGKENYTALQQQVFEELKAGVEAL
jgi:hypothetical protein